jgi:hypothetical protein
VSWLENRRRERRRVEMLARWTPPPRAELERNQRRAAAEQRDGLPWLLSDPVIRKVQLACAVQAVVAAAGLVVLLVWVVLRWLVGALQ